MERSVDQNRGRKNIIDDNDGLKLGERFILTDSEKQSGSRIRRDLSGAITYARLVKAEATLSPGNAVKFNAAKYGTHVDAVAADDGVIDGIVDPELSGNVASGDTFLLIVEGPVDVVVNGAVAGPKIVGAGSGKVKTALDSVATARGRLMEAGGAKSNGDTLRVYL